MMTLELHEVVPDPEQPRQHFDREAMARLKAAIFAVGQLQPIRVRWAGSRWMIVDGQRRWLALSALAKEHPHDERFQQIRAYAGDELDEDVASRRVVQVLSDIGEDLTPTEKAAALKEIQRRDPSLTVEELGERLGVPKGQVKFLQQLAGGPEFIREMGAGPGRCRSGTWGRWFGSTESCGGGTTSSSGTRRGRTGGSPIGRYGSSGTELRRRAGGSGSSRARPSAWSPG